MNENETIAESITETLIEISESMERSWFFKPLGALLDIAFIGMVAATGRVFV